MIPLIKTMTAGGFGGILFWLISAYSGTKVLGEWPIWGQLFGLAILGSGAALIGVYMLTQSDLDHPRTFVFAMLCGMTFNPIYNSGMTLVGNLAVKERTGDLKDGTKKLQSSIESKSNVAAEVDLSAPKIIGAVKSLSQVKDPDQKQELLDNSKAAVKAVEGASQLAPGATVEALKNIGKGALESNQGQVATEAINSLKSIATQNTDKKINAAVDDSLQELSRIALKEGFKSQSAFADVARQVTLNK